MLMPSESSMHKYLSRLAASELRFETSPRVRNTKVNKIARFAALRPFMALFFIITGDAYQRVLKVDPSRPIRYRKGMWVIRNQSQRADGTIYTSGNAAKVVLVNDEVVYDSTSIFD